MTLHPAVYNDLFSGELDPLALTMFSCLTLLVFERENRGARFSKSGIFYGMAPSER